MVHDVPDPTDLVLARGPEPARVDGLDRPLVVVDADLGPRVKVEVGHRPDGAVVLAVRVVGGRRLVVARVDRQLGEIRPRMLRVGLELSGISAGS